jgi:MFS family permease
MPDMATKHEDKGTDKKKGQHKGPPALFTFSRAYLLFFVLAFVYLWLVVEPHLIYHSFGTILPDAPMFATGWSFFAGSLAVPGGPVAYLSGFLSQGFCFAWLGAAIIVLAGFGLAELSRRHLITAGLTQAHIPATFPAIAFFLIYSRYKHTLTLCLAVSLGLLLSLVFQRLPWRRLPGRIVAFCLLAAVGFWLGGGGAVLVFAPLAALHAVRSRRDWATLAIGLPTGLVILWVLTESLFLLPPRQAFVVLTPFAPPPTTSRNTFLEVLTILLYSLTPLLVLLVSVAKGVFGRRGPRPRPAPHARKGPTKHVPMPRRRGLAALARPALAAVPLVVMALTLSLSHDPLRKPFVLSNYHWSQKQWDQLVELGRRLPKGKSNVFVNHAINRALYHTGRLPYDMFHYPQEPHALLLTHEQRESDLTQMMLTDLFLELGHVNMAQKLASELVTTKHHLGAALERLGWICIIKGQPSAARIYLNALRRDLHFRGRAASLLHGLDEGFGPEQAAYIDRIRSCVRDEMSGVTGDEPVDEMLAALLEQDPGNRMAFEYLMACYLLTGRVDRIAENVARLRELGYPAIPTLYEEAILIHYADPRRKADLAGFDISPETVRRYEAFLSSRGAMQSQNYQAMLHRLIRDFGTSYFFYFSFGQVGLL